MDPTVNKNDNSGLFSASGNTCTVGGGDDVTVIQLSLRKYKISFHLSWYGQLYISSYKKCCTCIVTSVAYIYLSVTPLSILWLCLRLWLRYVTSPTGEGSHRALINRHS
jgi:hypothetical protein